jgi:hypothetical protein
MVSPTHDNRDGTAWILDVLAEEMEALETACHGLASLFLDDEALHTPLAHFLQVAVGRQPWQAHTPTLIDPARDINTRTGFLHLAIQAERSARRLGTGIWLVGVCLTDATTDPTAQHAAARLLTGAFRESDILGELGPGRFAVLALHAPAEAEGAILHRLQERLVTPSGQKSLKLDIHTLHYDPAHSVSLRDLCCTLDTQLAR